MAYYEVASKKLAEWIFENHERVKDFDRISGGNSVSSYLAKYAYIPDIIDATFKQLRVAETNRILKSWFGAGK